MSLLQKIVAIEYPLGDILIMCVLARLLFTGELRNRSIVFLTAGGIGLLTADCVYGWIQLHGNWKVGGPTDLGWVAFYVLWGATALHPSMRSLTERPPERPPQLSMASLAVLSLSTLIAPVLLVWRALSNSRVNDAGVIGGVAALMFLLVMARLTGMARRQAALARREQALRAVGDRLVVATGVGEILHACVDAVRAMVGAGAVACLATEVVADGRELVLAANSPLLERATVAVAQGGGHAGRLKVELAGGAPVPGCGPGTEWSALSLSDTTGPRRRALVGHAKRLPVETRALLDALATQVMFAIGRVELARAVHRQAEEARFRSLVQNASEVILVVQASGRLSAETPSVSAILGYSPAHVASFSLQRIIHPDDAAAALALVSSMRAGTRSGVFRTEWRVRHADGRWLDMEVVASDLSTDAHVAGTVLTLRDVSDRKRLEGELRHRAFHDTLTELANRELFIDRVDNALGRKDRNRTTVSVLILDLDDFKFVNDTFGHVAGDQLLVAVGQRVKRCLRDGDTAARLGGDEFAVCAEFGGSGPGSGAQALAERIVEAFNEPFELGGIQVSTTVSIGVAVAGDGTTGAVDMLREADPALYAAKNAGKRAYRFFEPGLQDAASAHLASRAALEAAINNDELRLHFQPIVRLSDGCIVGAEALVRWEHPKRGLVPPAEFIPLAEESGLVVPLGAWVLDRAWAQLKRWSTSYAHVAGFKMTVNVSPRQLHAGDLVETVERALDKHDLSPHGLTLEITESVLVQDDTNILSCLNSLDERGITFALDDFGTGYSALSYLQRFPLKTLKIDRSFVAVMDGTGGRALIDAIIAMANSLGLEVVAEGIEFEGQARQLASLGCQYGQGYFYAKPMPAEAMEALLAKGGPLNPAGSYPSLADPPVPADAIVTALA